MVALGIVKLRLAAVSDAQHGVLTTGSSPVLCQNSALLK